jgi:hypothetical protein
MRMGAATPSKVVNFSIFGLLKFSSVQFLPNTGELLGALMAVSAGPVKTGPG